MDGEQPKPQEGEVKTPFIPAEDPKFQRVTALMQERQQANAASQETPATTPDAPPAEPVAEAPKKREKAEKTENQVRLEASLSNNIRLFSEGSDIAAKNEGAVGLTDRGTVVAENIGLLIGREANGNFKDLKAAVAEVKKSLRAEKRSMQRPEIKRVRNTFIAAGITPTKEQVSNAVDAVTSDQTKKVDASLALLDSIYKQKRSEDRKITAITRKAEVKDISLKLTDDEIAVFERDMAREGKKIPPKGLLRNMLAQRVRAGTYAIDPLAVRSRQMDTLIRESQAARTIPEQETQPVETPAEQPATKPQEGYVPGLSDNDIKELEKQNNMTPDERATYKSDAVAAAEESAFQTNRPSDATEGETFVQYKDRKAGAQTPEPKTTLEMARAEIKRMTETNTTMRDDLPPEVRDSIIEQHLSGQEPIFHTEIPKGHEAAASQETPTESIKATIIDFESKKQELLANQDKGRFGKLKGWGRKAVAAALVAGALLGAVKANDHTSGAYSYDNTHEQPGHTQTVDTPPTNQIPDVSVSVDNGNGALQGPENTAQTNETQPVVDTTVNEGEGLSQILERVNGSFDTESPKDWKNVEQMLDLNRNQLEANNPQLYEKIDAARKENPQLSGEQIKDLIHQGGENYPVTVFTGQVLKTPSVQ